MNSLAFKLTLAFIVVILVAVGVVAILVSQATPRTFGVYLEHQRSMESMMGGMMGPGMMGEVRPGTVPMMGAAEQDFLQSVNNSLWIAGLIAAAVAVGLGLFLSHRMIGPLRKLTLAARQVARGDLSHRVEVNEKDEVGELAQAFNAMADSLARNEQMRRQLVADIAHELRTPLSVVQGGLEAMLDGVIPMNSQRIASLYEESLLLRHLVDDLQALSLAEAGQLKLQRSSTDLADLVKKVIAGCLPQAEEKKVALNTDLPSSMPLALIDAKRITQVLTNLLSNALRYTPSGGIIRVKVEDGFQGGGAPAVATVSVADTGSGISPQDLPHIFDRFYRVDKSRSRTSGGSGIGLAIVKHLVEAHGGRVWVESQVDQGSTFYFTVPLSADPPSPLLTG